MRICLCTLVLNEMEWLPFLYRQHKDWPGVVRWVFVEAADVAYQECNPSLVSAAGLSVDGTSEYLYGLCTGSVTAPQSGTSLIQYIPHGIAKHSDKAQGKCMARQRYLDVCEGMDPPPDFVVVLDGDEFYTKDHQQRINRLLYNFPPAFGGMVLKQRHIWHTPLFSREVVGGYWDVPHCRIWRYTPGMRYTNNHNTPENPSGRPMREVLRRYDHLWAHAETRDKPECIHMGYASSLVSRMAKHTYYTNRGEGKEQGRLGKTRRMYVECRKAWEKWREGDTLPHGARVIPYKGPVPECFLPLAEGRSDQYIPPGHYVVEDADGERLIRKEDA